MIKVSIQYKFTYNESDTAVGCRSPYDKLRPLENKMAVSVNGSPILYLIHGKTLIKH